MIRSQVIIFQEVIYNSGLEVSLNKVFDEVNIHKAKKIRKEKKFMVQRRT